MSAFAASSTAPRDASRRRVAYSFASCRRASDASERTRDESDARRSELASAEVWRSAASRSDDATRSMESSMRARSDASNSEAFEAVETDDGGVTSGSNPGAGGARERGRGRGRGGEGGGGGTRGGGGGGGGGGGADRDGASSAAAAIVLLTGRGVLGRGGGGVERYLPMRWFTWRSFVEDGRGGGVIRKGENRSGARPRPRSRSRSRSRWVVISRRRDERRPSSSESAEDLAGATRGRVGRRARVRARAAAHQPTPDVLLDDQRRARLLRLGREPHAPALRRGAVPERERHVRERGHDGARRAGGGGRRDDDDDATRAIARGGTRGAVAIADRREPARERPEPPREASLRRRSV